MADRAGITWRAIPAALWSRRAWLATAHLITGGLLWGLPVYLAIGLAGLATKMIRDLRGFPGEKVYAVSVGLMVFGAVLLVLFTLTPNFTAWQRLRFRAVLGVELLPYPPDDSGPLRAALSARTWRQVCYHVLGGAFTAASALAVVVSGLLGVAMVTMPLVIHEPHLAARLIVLGAGLLLLTPWLARGAAWVDVAMAEALLQPYNDPLARRVATLSASRTAAIEAADAERRRIERNLHDGTQQRLVSLAMNLGLTRAALRDGPPELHQAIAAAHEEAKQALAELRDFIRGLHPAVLDELGLDAALSGIAARSPVPVRLTVELDRRPAVAVETVAYFVVSEALSNVARHAAASRAEVEVRQRAGDLMLSIVDDGRGGADPARGTGLRGLCQRVESVDGTLRIDSPTGGPTAIRVTLPCVS